MRRLVQTRSPFSKHNIPNLLLALGAAALGVFIVYPIIFTLIGSFWSSNPGFPGQYTLSNYVTLFQDRQTYSLILNTFFFAFGSSVFATSIGLVLSIITVRMDTPLRQFFSYLPFLPLAFPVFMANLAWIYLFAKRVGLFNILLNNLGLPGFFDIFSWPGLIWGSGMALVPISYITISSALHNMDSSLEEASLVVGSGILRTVSRVTIPLIIPSILSAFLLDFTLASEAFETPAMLGTTAGIDVFMSKIYNNVINEMPPDYHSASAEAAIIFAITMISVYLYIRSLRAQQKYEVVSGRGFSKRARPLGRWKYLATGFVVAYLVIGIIIPFATIVMVSLVPIWIPDNLFAKASLNNYAFIISSSSGLYTALMNSIFSALAAATIISLLSLAVVFVARRTRVRGRNLLEALGMFPIAMPSLVISFGLLWAFLTIPTGLWGTVGVMIVALSLDFLPRGIRSISGGIIQVRQELQEASYVVGANQRTTIRRIFLPLIRTSLLRTWIFVFIVSFGALGPVILLASSTNQLFSTLMWGYWTSGQVETFAGACVVLFLVLGAMILTMLFIQRRWEKRLPAPN